MIRFCLLALAVVTSGCGVNSRTSPVSGSVTLDGKPLAGASIHFVAQGSGRDATGGTDQNGEFTMGTFKPRDGAVPGTYKVVIAPPAGAPDTTQYGSAEDAMSAAAKAPAKKSAGPAFPEKYSRADQTPLTEEVPVKAALKYDLKSQ